MSDQVNIAGGGIGEAAGQGWAEKRGVRFLIAGLGGFLLGVIVTVVGVWQVMPGQMIVTEPSRFDFEVTVSKLEEAIETAGWVSPGKLRLDRSLKKHGHEIPFQATVLQLCKPEYAREVLQSDRYVSSLMPCAIGVWQGDDGRVYVSKMNTGLMGKMFGGTIARVMGDYVAKEEKQILAAVVQD